MKLTKANLVLLVLFSLVYSSLTFLYASFSSSSSLLLIQLELFLAALIFSTAITLLIKKTNFRKTSEQLSNAGLTIFPV